MFVGFGFTLSAVLDFISKKMRHMGGKTQVAMLCC
jgi:hypothetical protein